MNSTTRPGFLWGKRTVRGNFVKLRIELTETERMTLDQHKLWNYPIFELPNLLYYDPFWRKLDAMPAHPDSWEGRHPTPPPEKTIKIYIGSVCAPNGFIRQFETLGEAKNFALEARTHIQKIKDIIEHHSTPGKTETFDL